MRDNYDFSRSRKNPSRLKKQVTIKLGTDVVDYFKELAEETGIPYRSLIDLYLRDCAHTHRKLELKWQLPAAQAS